MPLPRHLILPMLVASSWPAAALITAGAQPPTVPALLSAAAAYVAAYEEQASGVMFEERYEQTVVPLPRSYTTLARRLRSEVVILNTGDLGWVGFRDVFEQVTSWPPASSGLSQTADACVAVSSP